MKTAGLLFSIALLALIVLPCGIGFSQNPVLMPGKDAPFFKLKNVDGRILSFDDYPTARGFTIIFISNTCPYSKAYEQRILDLDKKYAARQFPLIAVNSNDPSISPGDSYTKMKQRAKTRHYTFPYLCDNAQVVADLYGARTTPQVFIVSKNDSGYRIEYTGAIDNDLQLKNPARLNYAEDAIRAILDNRKPSITFTRAVSCSISRKRKQQG